MESTRLIPFLGISKDISENRICYPFFLIPEEIQNITQSTCIGFINFGVLTACASHGRKFLALNIKKFCQPSTGCRKLICFKLLVLTFWTLPIFVFHLILLHRIHDLNSGAAGIYRKPLDTPNHHLPVDIQIATAHYTHR